MFGNLCDPCSGCSNCMPATKPTKIPRRKDGKNPYHVAVSISMEKIMDKSPEWLDIVWQGQLSQINSEGDIRESITPKNTNKRDVRKSSSRKREGRQAPIQSKDAANKQANTRQHGGSRQSDS